MTLDSAAVCGAPVLRATDIETLARRLAAGRLHEPHFLLGPLAAGGIRAWLPGAVAAWVEPGALAMARVHQAGLFEFRGHPRPGYRLRWRDQGGNEHEAGDPYAHPPQIDQTRLAHFGQGEEIRAWQWLGAHEVSQQGVEGTRFAVWAPNAERVSVVGDWNGWNGLWHPMTVRGPSGIWELFIPGVRAGALYKFELRHRETGRVLVKSDPFARQCELRPRTASIVAGPSSHVWHDSSWLTGRPDWRHAPMAIYELHPGSWRRHSDGRFLDYRELAVELVPELLELGFTHVEFLPITEHPYDASWGYQTTGYFAPTSRFGTPDDFRHLVDSLHGHGIGVILDWVPGHFPKDAHALARFDGTPLFEHADPRRGETAEWDTMAFDFGRNEVRSFLVSSALYWLEELHCDGLRIDAVASMLYLDYGRHDGNWLPNIHGGRENLEAVSFLQQLNEVTHRECPGSVTIAEESTAWPAVTRPVHLGGLGFSMKWNMGWMHDTLAYMRHDPVHRSYHHDRLTFGLLYAHSENFVLPLSHDEVVHGKGSLYGKMPGDPWQRFANLRLLYAFMYAYPGKKLLFMGSEHGQAAEWDHSQALEPVTAPMAAGLRRLVCDLNRLYRQHPQCHATDFEGGGFEWVDCHDSAQSVITFLRRSGEQVLLVVCNFTPLPRHGYRVGAPTPGRWRELLNTDGACYGGSDVGNGGSVEASEPAWMGRPWSMALTLPPLGVLILAPEEGG